MTMIASGLRAFSLLAALAASGLPVAAPAVAAPVAEPSTHAYDITYRSFGLVTASSSFHDFDGYQLRFEGCYAKRSPEAVCGFTLRALRPIVVTNAENRSHGVRVDGSPMRSCCLFIQGEPEGRPLIPDGSGDGRITILRRPVEVGREIGVMLRLPDYKSGSPLQSVHFSRGDGDPGASFPATVAELP